MKKRFFLSKCFLTTRIKKYISCICDIDALGSLCQILIGWQVAQPIRLTGGLTPAQLQSPSLAKWRDVSSIRPRRRCVRGVTMQEAEQSECEWSHSRPVTDLRLTLCSVYSPEPQSFSLKPVLEIHADTPDEVEDVGSSILFHPFLLEQHLKVERENEVKDI